jgi:hypothetical protein
MNIIWKGCSSSNYSVGRSGKKVDKIVLHWMAGTLASTDITFNDGRRLASAHYGMGQTEIHQYVKEEDTAWHAGNFEVNQTSIGIEHEGGPDIPITEAVYKQSVELITDLCKRYGLDTSCIHKHNEYKATQCPGTLDVERIIREVGLALQPAQISDDQKRALDFITTNKGDSNFEGAVRKWYGDSQDKPTLESKAKQLEGFVAKWIEIWKLPMSSGLNELESEMTKLMPLEEVAQEYRDSIEGCVGSFPDDIHLLEAHKVVRQQIDDLSKQLSDLQTKLNEAKVPVGYKFLKSWTITSLLFKLYKRI